MTEVPGLCFLGLSWQHTRGSALLGWVGEDAKYIAEQIEAFRAAATLSETESRHPFDEVRRQT